MLKEKTLQVFYNLPWRIIKTTLSIILAAMLINSVSYVLFVLLLPIYPFAYMQDNQMVHIGSTTTSLYFAMMAATKGVGNSLSSTWSAIRAQMIANFFGALFGVIVAMTLGEIFGITHPLTIGIGIFFLFLVFKHLKLNEAFTLGGITFISVVVLSTNNYPPIVRGVDRFYSMGFGLFVSGALNIFFLSPVISDAKLFERLKAVQKLFCLQEKQSWDDHIFIENEMNQLDKEVTTLLKDEKLEKRIFFWKKHPFDYQTIQNYYQRSQLVLTMEKSLSKTTEQTYETLQPLYTTFKQNHYLVLFEKKKDIEIISSEMREWVYQYSEHHQNSEMLQFLDSLNQYELLLMEE